MKNNLESLCVLRLSAIGDVTNCLATIKALKGALPDTRISWVIGKTEAALIGDTPDIEFIIFDKARGLSAYLELRRELSGRRFDALLMMHASMRANLASLAISAKRKLGFDKARARDFQWLFSNERITPIANPHVIDGFLQFTNLIAGRELTPVWGIDSPTSATASIEQRLGNISAYAVISPCSSERARNFRNWPSERYASMIDYMADRYAIPTVLSGGNTERERQAGNAICSQAQSKPINLIGETSLPQLYVLLAKARLLISPDSGPMHIAVSAGTPAIGLFATSNPARTGPARRRELVVSHYDEALQKYLDKTIDTARWGERVRHPEAMLLVDSASVRERIDQCLGASNG